MAFDPRHELISGGVENYSDDVIVDLMSRTARWVTHLSRISSDGKYALLNSSRKTNTLMEIASGRQVVTRPVQLFQQHYLGGNFEWAATVTSATNIGFINLFSGRPSAVRVQLDWRSGKGENPDPILGLNDDGTMLVCRHGAKEAAIVRVSHQRGTAENVAVIECSEFIGFLGEDRYIAVVAEGRKAVRILDTISGAIVAKLPNPIMDLPPNQEDGTPYWAMNASRTLIYTLQMELSEARLKTMPAFSESLVPVTVHLWSVYHGALTMPLNRRPIAMDLHPDGRRLACSFLDNAVTLIAVPDGQPVCKFDGYGVVLGFTSDGKRLVTTTHEGRVFVYDGAPIGDKQISDVLQPSILDSFEKALADMKARKTAEENRYALTIIRQIETPVTSIATVSPVENRIAIVADNGLVRIYNLENGDLLTTSSAPADQVSSLCYSLDGRELFVGTQSGQLVRWKLIANTYQVISQGTNSVIRVGLIGSSGRAIWSRQNSLNGTNLEVIDLATGQGTVGFASRALKEGQRWAVSGNGQALAVPGIPRKSVGISVLDGSTGAVRAELPIENLELVVLSHDARFLAAGHSRGEIKIWNWRNNLILAEVEAHEFGVSALAFSPDGSLLLSGSDGGPSRIWETASGKELGRIRMPGQWNHVRFVGFSPDGRRALVVADGLVIVAEVPSPNGASFEKPSR